MELAAQYLEGLQVAGDSVHVSDEAFSVLVRRTCECVLSKDGVQAFTGDGRLSSIDPIVLKQAHAALVTLILEVAKHDRDAASISVLLEECKWGTDRIEEFTSIYMENKANLQILLSNIGSQHPHIVDVDWRLDYYLKNNHMEKVNKAVYIVDLHTEISGRAGMEPLQLSCTPEQLQDMVGKLKEACKSLERAAQQ